MLLVKDFSGTSDGTWTIKDMNVKVAPDLIDVLESSERRRNKKQRTYPEYDARYIFTMIDG
jgi:hypothetical protein